MRTYREQPQPIRLSVQQRRILSLWFPRLAAELVLRAAPHLGDAPLAVVADARGALMLASLTAAAEAAGLRRGMALGDARAICPGLVTRSEDALREAAFLAALRRWAGRFSPWVAEEGAEALVLDITGCAQLFGGEPGLVDQVAAEAADFGLTLRLGVADTPGRRLGAGALCRRRQPSRPCRRRHRPGGARHPLAGAEAALGTRRRSSAGLGTAGGPGLHRAAGRNPAPYRPAAGGGAPARSRGARDACSRSASAASLEVAAMPRAHLARRVGPAVNAGSTRRSAGLRSRSRRRGRRMFSPSG